MIVGQKESGKSPIKDKDILQWGFSRIIDVQSIKRIGKQDNGK